MNENRFNPWSYSLLLTAFLLTSCTGEAPPEVESPEVMEENGVTKIRLLPPGEGNPRNSEGDFISLQDGRILFVYTHYYEGEGGDNDPAYLAARFSTDEGLSWTREDVRVLANEGGMNVMSVSLLRLANGEIALFYLRKNSVEDCRPVMRLSKDEAQTWSEPVEMIPDEEIGYYVLNNDRVVQLQDGRLIAPVALHNAPDWEGTTPYGHALCYLSDDSGRTWRRSQTVLTTPKTAEGEPVHLQEPGVVALKEGRLMMFMRTGAGSQYLSYSTDQGENWSPPVPSQIRSPRSPASIERIPKTGDLLLVWNDNFEPDHRGAGRRTPFNVAVSQDEGKTWQSMKVLEDDPGGWYCYTAIEFVGDRVLLGHCAGQRATNGLALTQITEFEVDWLYQ